MKKSISLIREQDEAVVRIIASYVEQARSGHRPRLSDYLVRYPDYTNALVDFIAYYHVFEEPVPQGPDTFVSSEVLSEVSQLALESAWRHVHLSDEDGAHRRVTTLFVRRDRQRLTLADLANELALGADIVVQLEQRHIDASSIPLELFRRLAQLLQQPLYVIQTYFTDNRRDDCSNMYRDLQQKVAERQTTYAVSTVEDAQQLSFRQALLSSTQMSERQKDSWCKIIGQEIN